MLCFAVVMLQRRIVCIEDSFLCYCNTNNADIYYAVCIVRGKRHKMVECPFVCLSRRLITAAAAGGFAAEVGRGQQIWIDSCCCRAICGPRKFRSDCKEVQHTCFVMYM